MVTVQNYDFPVDLYYHKVEHLWMRHEPAGVRVGLDALSRDALGTIVHLALGEPGIRVARGEQIGSLEAEKMVSPLVAPVSGTVLEHNRPAVQSPLMVGDDPYGSGWLVLLQPSAFEEEAADLVHGAEQLRE